MSAPVKAGVVARHYFAFARREIARARGERAQALRHEQNGFPETAAAFRRLVTSTVRLARTYHRSGLAAKRRAEPQ